MTNSKKFEEKMTDKELYESTLGRPFDKKPQKGCGKIFEYERKGLHITGACGDTGYTDGFIPLCLDCKKPQNHSPQSGQESVKKVEKTSEGTPSDASKEVIFCQNTEGTFNLSEKIVYDIDDRGNKEFCRKEDIKTFIKKLKEAGYPTHFCDTKKCTCYNEKAKQDNALVIELEEIDKLAGDSFK